MALRSTLAQVVFRSLRARLLRAVQASAATGRMSERRSLARPLRRTRYVGLPLPRAAELRIVRSRRAGESRESREDVGSAACG